VKFKIDENLPAEIADDLRALGHDAMTVVDQGMTGFDDARLMVRVQDESRVFMTMDKGIADVRAYPPQRSPVWCCSGRVKQVAARSSRSCGKGCRNCWGFMSRGAWPWSATRQSGSVEKRHERACDSAPRDGH